MLYDVMLLTILTPWVSIFILYLFGKILAAELFQIEASRTLLI